MISKNNTLIKTQLLLILFLTFLFPLSKGGAVVSYFGAAAGVALFFAVLLMVLPNEIDRHVLLICVAIIVYLIIGTAETLLVNGSGFYFGYVRCINIVTVLLLFSSRLDNTISFDFFKVLLDIIVLFIVVGNIFVFLNVANLRNLMISLYTQYFDFITSYQIASNKPILVFGVHNIAAFIYQGILLLSFFTYDRTHNIKHLLYTFICLVLLLALKCTTSFGFAAFSICIIFYYQAKSAKKVLIAILILMIVTYVCYSLGFLDFVFSVLSQQSNGIIPRYLTGMQDLYGGNLIAIRDTALGIGFCISDGSNEVYGADSGYIITLTIGKIIYFISFYALLGYFLNKNMSRQKAIIVFIYLALMELGFVTFLYYKTIALIVFIVYFISSLERDSDNTTEIKNA